ncbi:MAG: hypothetical protein H0V97_06005 [Actinobacteria bacterium]|nr:hypothetical protein [Actinomycetota bacterium]
MTAAHRDSSKETKDNSPEAKDSRTRHFTSDVFGYAEDFFYVSVAAALCVAGVILLGYGLYSFVTQADDLPLSSNILEFLDSMLLVFIVTELIHTIRTVIDDKILTAEPFLIVGIVAAIRRLVVLSAEAKDLLGTPTFTDAMLEIGILTTTTLILGLAIFLLRKTTHPEPDPAHEPG